jgi:hypothetical protein
MKLNIEVPDDLAEVDIEAMLPEFFDELRARLANEDYRKRILNTEEGFVEFNRQYTWRGVPAAMVRASTYSGKNRLFEVRYDAGVWGGCDSDTFNRRPVYMLGSFTALDEKYGGLWLIKLAQRYLRTIKYTCTDPEKNRDNIYKLECRIRDNFPPFRRWALSLSCYSHASEATPCFGVGPDHVYSGYVYWWDGELHRASQMPIHSQQAEILRVARRDVRDMVRIINNVARGLKNHGHKDHEGRSGNNSTKHSESQTQNADVMGEV